MICCDDVVMLLFVDVISSGHSAWFNFVSTIFLINIQINIFLIYMHVGLMQNNK
jgi:hypothetical protein